MYQKQKIWLDLPVKADLAFHKLLSKIHHQHTKICHPRLTLANLANHVTPYYAFHCHTIFHNASYPVMWLPKSNARTYGSGGGLPTAKQQQQQHPHPPRRWLLTCEAQIYFTTFSIIYVWRPIFMTITSRKPSLLTRFHIFAATNTFFRLHQRAQ